LVLLVAAAAVAAAGPVEFGMREIESAIAARGLRPGAIRFSAEITSDAAETFRILPGRIEGGDLRGLMYGLLAAAEQIRSTGRLTQAKSAPATPIRGIRCFLHNRDLEQEWFYSEDYWREYICMLARNRFNRLNLVFAHQTEYLTSPYPFWLAVPGFPGVRVKGLTDVQRNRNLAMLRFISSTCAEHAVDFTLGIWEDNVQRGMTPTVVGLNAQNIGPYSYAALKRILAECPKIRSVQVRTNAGSVAGFYGKYVFPAIAEAGRRVTLDLCGWHLGRGVYDAALASGAPVRATANDWSNFLGRAYPRTGARPGGKLDLFEKPRRHGVYWEVSALGSNRFLPWGDPAFVRRAVPGFTISETEGFEIDAPRARRDPGDWFFYLLWGRLSYDPKTPEKVWLAEFQRRFGAAAEDVLEAYRQAGRVLPELAAALAPDPDIESWPELDPGDWCFLAGAREVLRERLAGRASARRTPGETSARFDEIATATEQALARARGKVAAENREWRTTEADFRTLALLARYHARKQMAADHLVYFDETSDSHALEAAKRELRAALDAWEKLVAHTEGAYPREMPFGPADAGHWRDKLVYVRNDLKLVEDRERTYARFGRFDFGFDFGAATQERAVEPRFRGVSAGTRYLESRGFGWVEDGAREAKPLTKQPPAGALLGDSIRGRGRQVFRVKTGPGEFTVLLLHPDGTVDTHILKAKGGAVDVMFGDDAWECSGVILKSMRPAAPLPAREWPKLLSRPAIAHTPMLSVAANRPLTLGIRVSPATNVASIRLHYRPVNQLEEFKTIETTPANPRFTIPAADVSPRRDLMYYFEVLNKEKTGWFEPDRNLAMPYFVVKVGEAK
jgi:hypothetical protein